MPESNAEINVDVGGGRQRSVPVHLPSNSKYGKLNAAKGGEEKPKKVSRVTTGEVIQRKPSMVQRVFASFVGADSSQSVSEHLIFEVLIPAAKNMVVDAIEQGIEQIFYGSSRSRHTTTGGRPGYTAYNRVHSSAPIIGQNVRNISQRARATHNFDEIVLASRGEAEDVLDGLRMLIEEYESATVADLFDLVGASGNFTDSQWGWYDLRAATVRNVREGYLLVLPRTVQIN
jgi:hypothetical protein